MMSSAFYPGAGLDIFPLIMFRNIKKWIYLDSQPRSEFGDNFYEGFERPKFIEKIKKIMEQNEFKLLIIDGDTYVFYNHEYKQLIQYETNSVFPNSLQPRHYECDTVVLCGFDIGECKNDFVNKYSNIITNNITYHDLMDEHLFSTKKVSTMIINKEWEYWEIKNNFIDDIKKNIVVDKKFINNNEDVNNNNNK